MRVAHADVHRGQPCRRGGSASSSRARGRRRYARIRCGNRCRRRRGRAWSGRSLASSHLLTPGTWMSAAAQYMCSEFLAPRTLAVVGRAAIAGGDDHLLAVVALDRLQHAHQRRLQAGDVDVLASASAGRWAPAAQGRRRRPAASAPPSSSCRSTSLSSSMPDLRLISNSAVLRTPGSAKSPSCHRRQPSPRLPSEAYRTCRLLALVGVRLAASVMIGLAFVAAPPAAGAADGRASRRRRRQEALLLGLRSAGDRHRSHSRLSGSGRRSSTRLAGRQAVRLGCQQLGLFGGCAAWRRRRLACGGFACCGRAWSRLRLRRRPGMPAPGFGRGHGQRPARAGSASPSPVIVCATSSSAIGKIGRSTVGCRRPCRARGIVPACRSKRRVAGRGAGRQENGRKARPQRRGVLPSLGAILLISNRFPSHCPRRLRHWRHVDVSAESTLVPERKRDLCKSASRPSIPATDRNEAASCFAATISPCFGRARQFTATLQKCYTRTFT